MSGGIVVAQLQRPMRVSDRTASVSRRMEPELARVAVICRLHIRWPGSLQQKRRMNGSAMKQGMNGSAMKQVVDDEQSGAGFTRFV